MISETFVHLGNILHSETVLHPGTVLHLRISPHLRTVFHLRISLLTSSALAWYQHHPSDHDRASPRNRFSTTLFSSTTVSKTAVFLGTSEILFFLADCSPSRDRVSTRVGQHHRRKSPDDRHRCSSKTATIQHADRP